MKSQEASRIRCVTFLSQFIAALVAGLVLAVPLPSAAEQESGVATQVVDAIIGGDLKLNMRARIEIADIDGSNQSEAYTLRTRLGYGTKPFHGLSGYAEFENVSAIASSQYFGGTGSNAAGQSIIADPGATEVNQAYALYQRDEGLNGSIGVGRQRIVLDDARFIGNVGWRQNEQTYDSARLRTSLGIEKLDIVYGYLWEVRRIFGNQGTQPKWRSRSHLVNVSYGGLPVIEKFTAFAYILDFRDSSAANSSTTLGFRATGNAKLADDLKLVYEGSYAHQTDRAKNPVDYSANYFLLGAALVHPPLGTIGTAFEFLGSDDGTARFVTPLATAHKFQGWADAFLNNGGVNGVQDLSIYLAPKLPMNLNGKLVYHHFWSDEGSNSLGDEIDLLLSRACGKNVSILSKFAYFIQDAAAAPVDRWRLWFQLELKI